MSKKRNEPSSSQSKQQQPVKTTLEELHQEPQLGYRIKILLHDLGNVAGDPRSEKRISLTTHPLYISQPYFTDADATRVRAASITIPDSQMNPTQNISQPDLTVEDAIYSKLSGFLDKRKASGDSRPCGPHDMLPIYQDVFGVSKEHLNDEQFLGRLNRSGLEDDYSKETSDATKDGRVAHGGKHGETRQKKKKR